MVYKPKKTVNGHKRNDRATRYRKRVKARKAARARLPVRSNVKRYVAEQLDKIAPDNRYYFNVTEETADKIKPTCQLDVLKRIYPFGASFQKRFINMEFRRMAPVIKSGMQTFPQLGSVETQWGHAYNASDYHYDGSSGAQNYIKDRSGNFNHWRSIIGRGIHMKSSSVYGTITAFPNVALSADLINSLRTADLCLHMFVLEDKAVTKTNFMDWYQDLFDKKKSDNTHYTENAERSDPDTWRGDTVHVPYCAGSAYVSNSTSSASSKFVASETQQSSPFGPKSDGTDEFLIDWRQFYKHDDDASTSVNHSNEVFHNTRPCTTAWDGSYDHSVLPINKSRFIVHEHKKWSIKPDSNGNVRRCIPWSYTFPEHYMTYEKELLDLPFYFAKDPSSNDKQGITPNWLFPRKQPFIVFCWSRCSTEGPLHIPNSATQGDSSKTSGFTNINHDDVFHIDMNMKCHYENALATKNVPTINKGKPLVHKRESAPAPARQAGPAPRRDAPMDPISRKYQQRKVRRDAKRGAPFTGPVAKTPIKKSNTYIGTDGNRYHISDAPPPQLRNAKRAVPGSDGKKSNTISSIISSAWEGIKAHPLITAEVIGLGAALVLAPELAPMIGRVMYSLGPTAARQFTQGSILRGIGQRASMQGYERLAQITSAGEGYFVPAGTELAEIYEAEHAAAGFVRGLPTIPSRASAEYGLGRHGLIDQTADVARFNAQLERNWTKNQSRNILVE